MHNFVYLAQRRSQEFSCKNNFFGGEGRAPAPLGCASDASSPPWLVCTVVIAVSAARNKRLPTV